MFFTPYDTYLFLWIPEVTPSEVSIIRGKKMGEPRFWIAVASFWVRWSWSHDLFCRSDLTAYFWSIAICSPLYWCLDIGNLARNPCEIKYLSNIHQALISGTGNVYFFQLMNFQNLFSVVNYTALIFLRPLFSGTRVTFYTPPSPFFVSKMAYVFTKILQSMLKTSIPVEIVNYLRLPFMNLIVSVIWHVLVMFFYNTRLYILYIHQSKHKI